MPCLLCHRRDDDSARIGFPGKAGHTPCIGCHQDQFAVGSGGPICTICHTNAETGALKGFPGLQSFGRKFDHNRHQRVNCSVCHKTADRGVALSVPSVANCPLDLLHVPYCITADDDVVVQCLPSAGPARQNIAKCGCVSG